MDPLSNPVWFSLRTGHAHLAQGDATVAGYPADVAPFAAVPDDGARPSDRGLNLALGHKEPVYFIGGLPSVRRRTMVMGQYVGVFDGDRLVAMGGERLFADRFREVSGICTDPLYGGRGYAGAIVRELVTSMLNRGLSPILHLSPANARAHHLYQSLGFVDRAELSVVKVTA